MRRKKGFTLVEVLVSTAIMAIAITSTLQILMYLLQMNESNQNSVTCMNTVQGYMDEMKNVLYDDIVGNYNGLQFTVDDLTNRGVRHSGIIYAAEIQPPFLTDVKVVICWENRNRIIGEDTNLNGSLDAGEDKNGNGMIDSPTMIEGTVLNRAYQGS
ncbi:MAG: type II secretion system GspH family protein [Candidatus Omnitrophica bacterium]|nr:type II secretion system GspH family protein [Candidatus Omnitrophota bacterium]